MENSLLGYVILFGFVYRNCLIHTSDHPGSNHANAISVPLIYSEDNAANREAYNNVIAALKSDPDGIRYQTFLIFNVLMEDRSPITTDGLLRYWEIEAYKKLSEQGQTSYHVQDYISVLDGNIAAVAALLHHGMELTMYIASCKSVLLFS